MTNLFTKKAKPKKLKTSDIAAAMAKRWAVPEHAIMWKVGEGTGHILATMPMPSLCRSGRPVGWNCVAWKSRFPARIGSARPRIRGRPRLSPGIATAGGILRHRASWMIRPTCPCMGLARVRRQ